MTVKRLPGQIIALDNVIWGIKFCGRTHRISASMTQPIDRKRFHSHLHQWNGIKWTEKMHS